MNRFRVLLFAQYAELLGGEEVAIELPIGATTDALIAALRALPGGAVLPARPIIARNLAIAGTGEVLAEGDELALLPPLAGG